MPITLRRKSTRSPRRSHSHMAAGYPSPDRRYSQKHRSRLARRPADVRGAAPQEVVGARMAEHTCTLRCAECRAMFSIRRSEAEWYVAENLDLPGVTAEATTRRAREVAARAADGAVNMEPDCAARHCPWTLLLHRPARAITAVTAAHALQNVKRRNHDRGDSHGRLSSERLKRRSRAMVKADMSADCYNTARTISPGVRDKSRRAADPWRLRCAQPARESHVEDRKGVGARWRVRLCSVRLPV